MRIEIVTLGKVSTETQGPPQGNYFELMGDGIHCSAAAMGPYKPVTHPPIMPGQCLI
jgi:hypothetical protein